MQDWQEVIVRTMLAVIVLFFMTKLLGKRQVSQLSMFEYITGITIGNIAGFISLNLDTTWYLGLLSLTVWVSCSFGIELLQMKSKRMRDFIDGKGTVLIEHGKVLEHNLRKERLTSDELMEQLRKRSAFKFADVEMAIMEPSGDINVLLKEENQPLTPKQLGMKPPPQQAPQIVIMDGKIMEEPLHKLGLNRQWLDKELTRRKLTTSQIYLAQVDANNQFEADLYDDGSPSAPSKIKQK